MEHDVIPTETQKTMPQWKWREIGSERQRAFFLPYRNLLDIRSVRRALAHSRAHINRNFHYDSDKPNKSSKTCCMQLQTIFFSLDFIPSFISHLLDFLSQCKTRIFCAPSPLALCLASFLAGSCFSFTFKLCNFFSTFTRASHNIWEIVRIKYQKSYHLSAPVFFFLHRRSRFHQPKELLI